MSVIALAIAVRVLVRIRVASSRDDVVLHDGVTRERPVVQNCGGNHITSYCEHVGGAAVLLTCPFYLSRCISLTPYHNANCDSETLTEC